MREKYFFKNEDGSAIILALLILMVVTVLGISAINTSTIEIQIAANDKNYKRDFYVAEAGWKIAADWLEKMATNPSKINTSEDVSTTDIQEINNVKNFGGGGTDVFNNTFLADTEDGTVSYANTSIPYWYNINELTLSIVPGSGPDYKKFTYFIRSKANRTQEIEVRLSKVYKIGYQ